MARMIPAFYGDETPPGEVDVFAMLAACPDNWVALHSLDLAPWNRGRRTEIDFLVIVPAIGIVCIEVKSQEDLAFDNGRWLPAAIKKSPFKQAADGRHTFRRQLVELAEDLRNVPVVHLCIFPRASFDLSPNLSVQPYELIDRRQFRSAASGSEFSEIVAQRMRRSIEADDRIASLRTPLTNTMVNRIAELCFPVRCFRPDAKREIEAREADIEMLLREQQKPVLLLALHNPRVIVNGPAGTGKTLIAMELARRLSEKGQRVALLCFNQLIGSWLEEKVRAEGNALPTLVAGRAVSVLAELADVDIPQNPTQKFWDQDLPAKLAEAFSNENTLADAEFDCVIIDEAQDVLARSWLWSVIRRLIRGGVMGGRFVLFGDFDHQVLADADTMRSALNDLHREARPVLWPLTENCRNYPIVGRTAVKLSGFRDEVYSGYRRTGGSVECYDLAFYDTPVAQGKELFRLIMESRNKGYSDADIVILSCSPNASRVKQLLADRGIAIGQAWQRRRQITFASVQAFKGMESKVVILTDLDGETSSLIRNLFYTGMTRATERVRVLCSKTFQSVLFDWMMTGEPT